MKFVYFISQRKQINYKFKHFSVKIISFNNKVLTILKNVQVMSSIQIDISYHAYFFIL